MNRHSRQLDIIKVGELDFPIYILGAGGIGSWTTLMLAKMGCSDIIVYDDDIVEEHNVASQFFEEKQLGMQKIEALKENVFQQTGVEIECAKQLEENYIDKGLIIITIDSMEERIRLGEIYKDKNIYIIDGRMGGLVFEIYAQRSSKYLSTTVAPENVDHDACTGRSISFNCGVIAGFIANLVRQYAKKLLIEAELVFDFDSITLCKKLVKEPIVTNDLVNTETMVSPGRVHPPTNIEHIAEAFVTALEQQENDTTALEQDTSRQEERDREENI